MIAALFPIQPVLVALLLFVQTPVDASSGCVFCADGVSGVTLPDKVILIPGQGEVTCGQAGALTPLLLPADSEQCRAANQLSTLCGCPRIVPNSCDLCPDGSSIVRQDQTTVDTRYVPQYAHLFGGEVPNCDLMEALLHSVPEENVLCSEARNEVAAFCGCPNVTAGVKIRDSTSNVTNNSTNSASGGYGDDFSGLSLDGIHLGGFGARSVEDDIRLGRFVRASAALSLLGALLVIGDNLWRRFRAASSTLRKQQLYHQIMFTMASVDLLVALAAMYEPSTERDQYIVDYNQTHPMICKAQGWLLQFGIIASLFLNASLSTYFLLVIVYSFRAATLKRLTKYMICIPLLIGFILSFAALPYYTVSLVGCHLTPPVGTDSPFYLAGVIGNSWGPYLGFYLIPAWLVVGYATLAMGRVYFYVSRINRKANKWRFHHAITTMAARRWKFRQPKRTGDAGRAPRNFATKSIQSEVFWQSVFYLASLYLSWLTHLVVVTQFDKYVGSYYRMWLFVSFLYPLQPFLNCLVYFRPRLAQRLRNGRSLRVRLKKGREGPTRGSPNAAYYQDNGHRLSANGEGRDDETNDNITEPTMDADVQTCCRDIKESQATPNQTCITSEVDSDIEQASSRIMG